MIAFLLICSASAKCCFVFSAHSCGGSKVFICIMLPLPSLFITIFILVAFTRSGLMSNPKKFSLAVSEILSLKAFKISLLQDAFSPYTFSKRFNRRSITLFMAVTTNPPVPQLLSRTFSKSLGLIMSTAIFITFRGVKNSPRSPRKFAPTISSYALPLMSMFVLSKAYFCNSATMNVNVLGDNLMMSFSSKICEFFFLTSLKIFEIRL